LDTFDALRRAPIIGSFWQGCWPARSVDGVEVNGYKIEPGANLSGANLLMADLTGVDLRGADLEGADLREAKLTGANLEGANLGGVFLYRAKANQDTTWPEGCDPVAAGVIFE
jgi:uncharacterized protein YjbI with pentapeptide repeats